LATANGGGTTNFVRTISAVLSPAAAMQILPVMSGRGRSDEIRNAGCLLSAWKLSHGSATHQ
jgi:hypothetical protein